MAKYMVLHTPKKSAEEVLKMLADEAPQLAQAMASGQTPAKCLFSWSPLTHGRTDYVFCLWEASKSEDIEAMLESARDYLTADIMQVDEMDWAAMAKAAS